MKFYWYQIVKSGEVSLVTLLENGLSFTGNASGQMGEMLQVTRQDIKVRCYR